LKNQTEMPTKFSNDLTQIGEELENLEVGVQELSLFAFLQAHSGNIKYANDVVYAFRNAVFIDIKLLIGWFEKYGKLSWSNKRGGFVFTDSGKWQLAAAEKNHWRDLNLKANAILRKPGNGQPIKAAPLTEENFDRMVRNYLLSNPIQTREGQFGLPADKNRWGRYKLKLKRK